MAKKNEYSMVSRADEDKKWQAECDMRALMEAEKIKADPKRLKAAQEMAKEKMMEVAKVASNTDTDD